ncbi:TIGR03862 family flavoprotein [Agrobacterium vaccinii]|uniref:TIGR03862 family flavoprotein n=1 Tax=Agrobacterium vaccinii TaxID=2735528 RepID=UPI001E3DED22|nr:TIGR03862 family flavoprotein [Agrobacterium vaccinii]UHS64002.1 TIGR03862 family flavoprotein [Agrobacterium vaccinii]
MHGRQVAIIGGGPAGLMAAEVLSAAGIAVTVYEAMPTVARKFLMAGKSGLNITHAEAYADFVTRFGQAGTRLRTALDDFTPAMLRDWALSLGQETFTGTSGRVFPVSMKASPLLRAWLTRLEAQGVQIKTRHRWIGFDGDALAFETPAGPVTINSDAVLLALGGASWPKLGSNAQWVPWLRQRGVAVNDFQPANCGFDVSWSDYFRERFAGVPVKSVAITSPAGRFEGEFVVTRHGVEGSLVYAHSAVLRDAFDGSHKPDMIVDLMPGRKAERLVKDLERHSRKDSLSNRLRKAAGLSPVKVALLRECRPDLTALSPAELAALIKAAPIALDAPRPIAEAISSAGGIDWKEIDSHYMLTSSPNVFVAGEMVDWEAPTGGYLLTACFAMGKAAAKGIIAQLDHAR